MQHGFFRIALRTLLALAILLPFTGAGPNLDEIRAARNAMVDEDIVAAGVTDPRVVESMRKTERHEFVPAPQRPMAYYDMALPIGEGQTISPPFIVAYMTEQLHPRETDKVLEIGTGSGYQAAILSPLVKDVYTIEIVHGLGVKAAKVLKRLKYKNVHTRIGDGYKGWPEEAPFDKIIVTCSPENIPQALIDQLKEGGVLLIPLGERYTQRLYLYRKENGKLVQEPLLPVLFVPMTGAAEGKREIKPDPTNPSIVNGGFEQVNGNPPVPEVWYYQRQLKLVENDKAPEGKNYVLFTNAQPGRGAAALEGLAIDGRVVKEIELSAWIRTNNLKAGPTPIQSADVAIQFYDDKRNPAGDVPVGPWYGDSDWRKVSRRFAVPANAREAIIRIGLFGGTGELALDDVKLTVLTRDERGRRAAD